VIAAPGLRPIALLLLTLQLTAQSVSAQHVLVAGDGGQMFLVCSANGDVPRVEKEGKVVPIIPHGFALREVPEFAPFFVKVSNVNVRTTYADGGQLNNDFYFNADFEADSRLTDVFVVLALDSERAGKTLFLWGIGTLDPKKAKGVSIIVPMDSAIGSGRYQVHLFSGGAEVLQSLVPFMESETALDRMVASRIKDVHNAAPKFFFGHAPEYPPELKKANLKGRAIVSVRIGPNGAVYDPIVKSATDPAFGEAALRAVKVWRFLPKVKDDYPMETKVDVPIVFAQPNPAADSS
jgi:TonB family protein